MIEQGHWHPVAAADDVGKAPVSATLLDRKVVLWRDEAGGIHAWSDACPHRGASLSLGQVVKGQLECAYHGWQFRADGQCAHVPALPSFTPSPAHCAQVYGACEACGLVWVRLATAPGVAAPLPPAFDAEGDPHLRKLNCGPYDVATSAPRIVENFLDMAHFGFVHEGLLGTRSNTAIDNYDVKATPQGLLATQCRAWQPQSNLHSTAPAQVEYTYEVIAPYTAVLTKAPDAASVASGLGGGAYRESIALFICPVSAEHSRVWFRLAMADFESGDDKLRAFQNTIFMQDKPVLESQTPKRLPLGLPLGRPAGTSADRRAELHTVADKASAAYRRHLHQLGITFGVC